MKQIYEASRRWDYWTDSLMDRAKAFGDDPKECWEDAVESLDNMAKMNGEDIEEYALEVIEFLNKLGVNDRRVLAKAVLDWAFMMRYMGGGKGKRDDSYKQFMTGDVLGEDGLQKLADYYWEDAESGFEVL